MYNIIAADIYRIKRCIALYIIIFFNLLTSYAGMQNVIEMNPGNHYNVVDMVYGTFGKPDARAITFGEFLLVEISILVILFTISEFSMGTIKNVISVGVERYDYYLSKLVVVSGTSVIILLMAILSKFITGLFIPDLNHSIDIPVLFGLIRLILLQSMLHIAFASTILMVTVIVKNGMAVLGISVSVIFFFTLILPTINSPAIKAINEFWLGLQIKIAAMANSTTGELTKAAFIGLAYLTLSTCIGLLVIRKQDIR
jgi:ABC-2 type transport system permease protein